MQQRSLRSVRSREPKRRLRLIHANVRSTIHRLGSACLYRKLDSTVMVMKSADDRHRYDAAYVLDGAMDRSVFAKRPMSPNSL